MAFSSNQGQQDVTFSDVIKSALTILILAMNPVEGQAIAISGTVKNPSGAPISGARILLANANLSDTTGSDGAFLIQSPGTRVKPGAASQPGSRLSAGLHGGVLTVAAEEGSRVSLRVFSQLGQELFSGTYTAAGAASVKTIGIPGIGTEKVIVRIRSGANTLAVQGHARQGAIQARIHGAKAAALEKGSAAIPDSLVITKEGFLRQALHLATSDTSGLDIRMTGSTGRTPPSGTFRVSLVHPTGLAAGYTTFVGAIYGGPIPVPMSWHEVGKSGSCKLLTPRAPFCDPPCGATGACIADNICMDYPRLVSAGAVTVMGVKSVQGATQITVDPTFHRYIVTPLAYPPFAEGDDVSIRVPGDSGVPPFTLSAKGIPPLEILTDSIFLADGEPMALEWASPAISKASTVFIKMDLSHHGGTRGKIECEGPDNGKLEIAATLIEHLKALGVSGYPTVNITRQGIGTNAEIGVDLVLESPISMPVSVPGLISCSTNEDCPAGQACQPDMQCK